MLLVIFPENNNTIFWIMIILILHFFLNFLVVVLFTLKRFLQIIHIRDVLQLIVTEMLEHLSKSSAKTISSKTQLFAPTFDIEQQTHSTLKSVEDAGIIFYDESKDVLKLIVAVMIR